MMVECGRAEVSCVEVNEELLAESDFDMDENICDNSDSK
jgi:hypothetical protein